MKKVILGAIALSLTAIVSISCEKEITSKMPTADVQPEMSVENNTNVITYKVDNEVASNLDFNGSTINGSYLETDVSGLTFNNEISNELSSLEYNPNNNSYVGMGNIQSLSFSNFIEIDDQSFSFNINVNGNVHKVEVNTSKYNMLAMQNLLIDFDFEENPIATNPFVVVEVIGIIVSVTAWAVEETMDYCTAKIQAIIANCSSNGYCVNVGFCNANCVPCP